ncbi:TIR domain-containing protein [Acinetobacter modestus]|uniref:TIR domain-containing protein n=1 Tax=Acinetobacter modestus TaxID=1776740 RepID=UPI001F4A472E|nr:nucleotide-binding protein [Acinetobacter modestus]MCH7328166.1 nucleotide-binding protein [Acinetobacter modestus]
MANDLFKKIDNTVLDLQASHFQTYEASLQKLARLLNHPNLQVYNEKLVQDVDIEQFLQESEESERGMLGSARLEWTNDDEKNLALQYLLIQKLGTVDGYASTFSHYYFYANGKIINHVHNMVRNLIIPFVRDYKIYIQSHGETQVELKMSVSNNKIFIVHGHDHGALQSVARYLEKHKFEAIILHEQANSGRTIIEKIEVNSDVGFAIVLLTPDDLGKAKDANDYSPRARQNVILELGYFIGKLGRDRVCALKSAELEIPSDYVGVVWTEMDRTEAWKFHLAKELKAAGYNVDMNKVI